MYRVTSKPRRISINAGFFHIAFPSKVINHTQSNLSKNEYINEYKVNVLISMLSLINQKIT